MAAAFRCVDIIGIGIDIFGVAFGILKGDFQTVVIHVLFVIGDGVIQGIFVAVDIFDIRLDAAFVVIVVGAFHAFSRVLEGDGNTFIEKGQLSETMLQDIVIIDGFIKNVGVGLKINFGPGAVCFADHFQFGCFVAMLKSHAVNLFILFNFANQGFRQRVDNGNPDAVKPAGDLITAVAEFTAGMQHG